MLNFFQKHIIYTFILGIITGILFIFSVCFMIIDNPVEMLKFVKNYMFIKNYYFQDVSDEELFKGASVGLFEVLNDPYSKFLTKEEYSLLLQETNGEYTGIGVILGKNEANQVIVMKVLEESSAKEVGLLSGDIIFSIDGKEIINKDLSSVSTTIRGKIGTQVTITIKRENVEKTFELTRRKLNLPTVQSSKVANNIGYIHIFSFGQQTAREVKSALNDLTNKGANKFIIDLRMNPGGILDSVVDVSNLFLKKGTIVSYCPKNRNEKVYKIDGVKKKYPLVVLIDKYSASASEIFAGAVQDKKEGVIIGEKSFGKGTVQSIISNSDGTAVKVSIGQYKTANGRVIDKIGIIPDEEVKQTGQVFNFKTDSVYNRAIEILRKIDKKTL